MQILIMLKLVILIIASIGKKMKINKLYDDVYEINDFLDKETLDSVYKIIDDVKDKEDLWNDANLSNKHSLTDFWYGKNLIFEEPTIFDKVNDNMKSLLESYSYYPSKIHLSRYKQNDFIREHRDQWIPDLPYYIGYGFCLYYNDDYEGGELEYPELEIVVKPKANSLYIHGGHILHKSLPVLSNDIRYFSTVFIHGTTELPTKLKEELFK